MRQCSNHYQRFNVEQSPKGMNFLNAMAILRFMCAIVAFLLAIPITTVNSHPGGISTMEFWSQKLNGLEMPPDITARLAPSNDNVSGRLEDFFRTFCQTAHHICKGEVDIITIPLTGFGVADKSKAPALLNVFANYSQIVASGTVTLPNFHENQLMRATFLPSALAENLPLATTPLSELLQILAIPPNSNMSLNMGNVLSICNGSAMRPNYGSHTIITSMCATSVESMVSFVASILGSHATVYSDPSVLGSEETASVVKVETVKQGLKRAPISCHAQPFPFAVYFCHHVTETGVKKVWLRLKDGIILQKTLICHAWQESLQVQLTSLGFHEGEEACHWVYGSNLLWFTPA